MTEITLPFHVSVFEKLRFRPSTLHHLADAFKFLHPGDRFRMDPFSVTENAVFGVDGKFIRISVDWA